MSSVAKNQPTWWADLGGQRVTIKANTKSEARACIKAWVNKATSGVCRRLPVGTRIGRLP